MEGTNVLGKATCVAESFLSAWGLQTSFDSDQKLVVEGVKIGINDQSEAINLSAEALASRDVYRQVAECNKVLSYLGLPAQSVPRPQTGAVRAKTEDYHEVAMRLTQFRRTANPPERVLSLYRPIIQREAQRASRLYSTVLHKMGYTWEDLMTIGYIYAINHYHTYMTKKADIDANQKFLVRHLQQQFGRWASVTNAMLRNVLFDNHGVELEEYCGKPVEGSTLYNVHTPTGETIGAYEMVVGYKEEDSKDRNDRQAKLARAAAKKSLEAGLSSLGHDRMVFELRRVITDDVHQDYSARRLARQLFDAHAANCPDCQKLAEEPQERFLSLEERVHRQLDTAEDIA